MKIEFEVPEWAIGRHIFIFAGTELLGEKQAIIVHENGEHVTKYLPLTIKPEHGRCTGCGDCCSDGIGKTILFKMKKALQGFKGYDGPCPFLGENGCILGAFIPFSCARSVMTGWGNCTEKLEKVE